jgi:hypothetical protein
MFSGCLERKSLSLLSRDTCDRFSRLAEVPDESDRNKPGLGPLLA